MVQNHVDLYEQDLAQHFDVAEAAAVSSGTALHCALAFPQDEQSSKGPVDRSSFPSGSRSSLRWSADAVPLNSVGPRFSRLRRLGSAAPSPIPRTEDS